MLTHANLVTAVRQAQRGLRMTPDDVVAVLAPLHHVMGFVVTLGCGLAAGARLVMLPRFDPRTFVRDVQDVTVLIVPPPVLGFLVAQPEDLPSVELIVSGGAPLGAPLQQAVAERFPHAVGRPGLRDDRDDGGRRDPRPRARHRARLGRAGSPPTPSCGCVEGELLIRGPQTMRGYLGAAGRPDRRGRLGAQRRPRPRRRRRQRVRRRPPEGADQGQRAAGGAGRARGGAGQPSRGGRGGRGRAPG